MMLLKGMSIYHAVQPGKDALGAKVLALDALDLDETATWARVVDISGEADWSARR